jgi:hypothetical protein
MSTKPCTSGIVALVVTGPGSKELERLEDMLDSIRTFAPEITETLVLNDGNDPKAIGAALNRHGLRGSEFTNPRAGKGHFGMGRMIYGLLAAYAHVRENFPGHHVLRMDSDALIIRPFFKRLMQLVASNSDAGIVGSPDLRCPAKGERLTPAVTNWHTRIYRLGKQLSRWDEWPYLRVNLFGANAAMRRIVEMAMEAGYRYGYHAQGGAYLLTAEANRRFAELPPLTNVRMTTQDCLSEDVFFAIAIHAVKLKILPQRLPGDIFASVWNGLMGETLEEVDARSNAIIHSLKDYGPFQEVTTRQYFRERRVAPVSSLSRESYPENGD